MLPPPICTRDTGKAPGSGQLLFLVPSTAKPGECALIRVFLFCCLDTWALLTLWGLPYQAGESLELAEEGSFIGYIPWLTLWLLVPHPDHHICPGPDYSGQSLRPRTHRDYSEQPVLSCSPCLRVPPPHSKGSWPRSQHLTTLVFPHRAPCAMSPPPQDGEEQLCFQ